MSVSYEYDAVTDALYVRIQETAVDAQVELADGVVVDVDAMGEIVGIDVMNPSGGWDVESIVSRWPLETADVAYLRSVANWMPSVSSHGVRTAGSGARAVVATAA